MASFYKGLPILFIHFLILINYLTFPRNISSSLNTQFYWGGYSNTNKLFEYFPLLFYWGDFYLEGIFTGGIFT
jgi:hypothetical protein